MPPIKISFPTTLPAASGIASGSLQLSGSPNRPSGNAHVVIEKGEAYDEHFDRAQFDAALENEKWRIANGRLEKGAAVFHFSGEYQSAGQLRFKLDSNVFALSSLDQVRRYEPGLDAQTQIHLDASARIAADRAEPTGADGRIEFRDIKRNKISYGNLTLNATTGNNVLRAALSGELDKVPLHGTADAHLIEGFR